MICFDCKLRRNKMVAPVYDAVNRLIGYLCVKCSKKKYVENRPKGAGWRSSFTSMLKSFVSAKNAEKF